jgi:hypothetical protein
VDSKRWVPLIIGLGAVLGLVSALADVIGLGRSPGLGLTQTAGLLAGVALVIIGVWWRRRS